MFWGYADCNDSLAFKNELFDSSGDISLNMFFEGIDELLEEYDDYYSEIKAICTHTAFLILNLAFGKLVNSEEFSSLDIKTPFYVLGAEHDEDPVLIYKHIKN